MDNLSSVFYPFGQKILIISFVRKHCIPLFYTALVPLRNTG